MILEATSKFCIYSQCFVFYDQFACTFEFISLFQGICTIINNFLIAAMDLFHSLVPKVKSVPSLVPRFSVHFRPERVVGQSPTFSYVREGWLRPTKNERARAGSSRAGSNLPRNF